MTRDDLLDVLAKAAALDLEQRCDALRGTLNPTALRLFIAEGCVEVMEHLVERHAQELGLLERAA